MMLSNDNEKIKCPNCRSIKNLNDFFKNDKILRECINCRKLKAKYRNKEAHKINQRNYMKTYYINNKEKFNKKKIIAI